MNCYYHHYFFAKTMPKGTPPLNYYMKYTIASAF